MCVNLSAELGLGSEQGVSRWERQYQVWSVWAGGVILYCSCILDVLGDWWARVLFPGSPGLPGVLVWPPQRCDWGSLNGVGWHSDLDSNGIAMC